MGIALALEASMGRAQAVQGLPSALEETALVLVAPAQAAS